ncbi:hypothetical protein J437_LFUL006532 [Ladona fulva]|uniref:PiggyBac transposable element-derived protein domain-containing protein n=1 Tax=Ladona fulva TaxID=123851 RepID=A0A8K0KI28_LADFU|nr:hypothetical protein J437_LFUL006532 [Ladona fulva]
MPPQIVNTKGREEKKKKKCDPNFNKASSKSIDKATGGEKKPGVIAFYNYMKGGIDTVDKMCATYDMARNTRRWTLAIFFHLLNTAGINSYIIFNDVNKENRMRRQRFLQELSLQLTRPFITKLLRMKIIPRAKKKGRSNCGAINIYRNNNKTKEREI